MIRKIVEIDEVRCDGCGDCIPSCAEGAIALVNGKARLSADALCDGLGACLGECPQGAIRVVEREAEAFDEVAVAAHLSRAGARTRPSLSVVPALQGAPHATSGCPGSRMMDLAPARPAVPSAARPRGLPVLPPSRDAATGPDAEPLDGSRLGQWPVQLHLVSTSAPYFGGADLLVAADCVPFAYARFHEHFLEGRRVVVGCPKLDDNRFYVEKLAELFRRSGIRSVTVVKMEVPCCGGIAWAAREALALSGKTIPLEEVTVGVRGDLVP
jgi:NAD-dependent dihydropyrimidine dehydrogenase PreA subunit